MFGKNGTLVHLITLSTLCLVKKDLSAHINTDTYQSKALHICKLLLRNANPLSPYVAGCCTSLHTLLRALSGPCSVELKLQTSLSCLIYVPVPGNSKQAHIYTQAYTQFICCGPLSTFLPHIFTLG